MFNVRVIHMSVGTHEQGFLSFTLGVLYITLQEF